MRTVRYVFTAAFICAVIIILSACGGGGSEEEFVGPPERKLYSYCTTAPQPCNS